MSTQGRLGMQAGLFGAVDDPVNECEYSTGVPDLQTLFGLEVDVQLADGAQRFEAVNPFSSYIVQAPAGSGKTALLTQRFLALLSQVNQPEKIVAMTFTKKAAAEMRERILGALKTGLQSAPSADASLFERNTWKLAQKALQRDSEQAWSLLQNPNRLRIKTIDGINGFLVGQMPLLSKMGAQPRVTDQATRYYQQAARMALKDDSCQAAMADLLRLVNGRYQRAEALIVSMLGKRDQWMQNLLSVQDEAARDELEWALQLVVEQEMQSQLAHLSAVRALLTEAAELADYARANGAENLQPLCAGELGNGIDSLAAWRSLADWLLTGQDQIRKSVTKNNGFPAGKGAAKENKERFVNALAGLRDAPDAEQVRLSLAVLKGLPEPHYSDEQWQSLQSLIHLLKMAAAYLKVAFRHGGEADFIEIAQAASQALGREEEPTELAQHLDYRIEHLLVDEFQDTSREQYALIRKLVAGWQPGDARTLFIVGDPMQSIYRFREAEVGNFLDAWQGRIGDVQLTPLNLQVNFRSSRAVIDWVNRQFKQVFPKQNRIASGAVCYSDSLASSEDDTPAVFTHWQLNQTAESEAVDVVQLIKQRLRELDSAAKIAVLGRTRSSLMTIASLLKQQEIGFRAVELEGLAERQEIQDVLALSRALLHLADRPAWIALLRSPLVGLNLPDLHALLGEHFSTPAWQQIQPKQWPESLSERARQRLAFALPVLHTALQRLGSMPFSLLVRECWLQLDGAHSVENQTALDNVTVFWETLAGLDGEVVDAQRLEEMIANLYASPDAAQESQRIELMTMHKSKGLEFDTVILPGLGRKPRSDDKQLLSWMSFLGPQTEVKTDAQTMREWLVMAPLDQKGQGDSLLTGLLRRFEQEKQDYELGRLLYVAATRAKRQLHLFGEVRYRISDREESPRPLPNSGSLLEALWPCVQNDFVKLAADYDEVDEAIEAFEFAPKIRRLPLQRAYLLDQLTFASERHSAAVQKPDETPTASKPVALSASAPDAAFYESSPEQALLNTSVGNLVHLVLEQWASLESWPEVREQLPFYRYWLRNQGVEGTLLEQAIERVLRSLTHARGNAKLVWALDQKHREAQCEYPLTSLEDDGVANHIVDRTFVDEGEVRWIVDYKTSHLASDAAEKVDAFVEKQVEVYRPQLERYGKLLAEIDRAAGRSRAQKWVLYFTDMDRWVELN
ncbi:UvrD-helicase domain-containing protein [Thiomicrorhabdus sp. zzn3]|uniref:UvrD-helicase domain-containing protein n=1 Tax=Thiomicrorhabdus sp. zzn3 TaxID=3039775 RepID=UPI002436CDCF|nr:UvrD-helicase domain-containing protein [Thiomicrorhabdus sp. zzn3]MDG6778528.1 UvrD-helicase domain-containing protein [Thiomicrorhabdus sp. zzn3]